MTALVRLPARGVQAPSLALGRTSFAGARLAPAPPRAPRRPAAANVPRLKVSAALNRYADLEEDFEYEVEVRRQEKDVVERVVQWYPGHIARAERLLKEQLSSVDIVIEVRDARIPYATQHPEMNQWINNKPKVVVMNRVDMITDRDKNAWSAYFARVGETVVWTDGKNGKGVQNLIKRANSVSKRINDKRKKRGLKPRNVRAAIVGYPNVGKSALVNRMLGKRYCPSAQRPGVTRQLRWLRVGGDVDLLDSPGVLPMRMADQDAATRLAICNDIGGAAYLSMMAGASLVDLLRTLPSADELMEALNKRYGIDPEGLTSASYVAAVAEHLFQGDPERAGERLLNDFRKGNLGEVCLEVPRTK